MNKKKKAKTVTRPENLPQELTLAVLRRKGVSPAASDDILQQMKSMELLVGFLDRIVFFRPQNPSRADGLAIHVLLPDDLDKISAQGRIRDDVGVNEGDTAGAVMMLTLLSWTAKTMKQTPMKALVETIVRRMPSIQDICLGVEVTDAHLQEVKDLLELEGEAPTAWGFVN